jgi:proteasome lid subunit RPN8/RPN11
MAKDALENLLNSEAKAEVKERDYFSNMYITKEALEKAQIYAALVKDHSGKPIECMGYCIGDPERKSRVVEDIYFAPNQDNHTASTKISAESVVQAGREIRAMNKRVLGWWHSHADFNPFHSGTDIENHQTVAYQIAPSNYITVYDEVDFLESEIKKTTKDGHSNLIICDRNNSSKRLEIFFSELEENPLSRLPIEKILMRVPRRISYAYSMVVNAIGTHPYTEVATLDFCPHCNRDEYAAKVVQLKVMNYSTGIAIDEAKMKEEIKQKMRVPRIMHLRKIKSFDTKKNEGSEPEVTVSSDLEEFSYGGDIQPVRAKPLVDIQDEDLGFLKSLFRRGKYGRSNK